MNSNSVEKEKTDDEASTPTYTCTSDAVARDGEASRRAQKHCTKRAQKRAKLGCTYLTMANSLTADGKRTFSYPPVNVAQTAVRGWVGMTW